MSFVISVSLLAAIVAVACALPGVVLVLRRQAMLSDALSHAVLPGIAIAGLWAPSTRSPWLIVGATLGALAVVALTEWIRSSKLVTADAATGLVFPAFFALGIIVISSPLSRLPINEQTVLVGDLNVAAIDHLIIGRYDMGPKDAWLVAAVGLLTALIIFVFRRPLTVSTFDPVFGATVGLRGTFMHYLIMAMVALTTIVAFNSAGAILVVALMIVPAATAALLARSVGAMFGISLLVALVSSQLGFWGAYLLDAATSPVMALVLGLVFLCVFGIKQLYDRRQRIAVTTKI